MKTPIEVLRFAVVMLAAAMLGGCAVGPNYERPAVSTPGSFRRAPTDTNTLEELSSLATLPVSEVFKDQQLNAYIVEAASNNFDIKIAAARVLQAEAVARVTRSQFWPTIAAGGDWTTARSSQRGPSRVPAGVDPQVEYGSVFAAMSTYEVDLWGRLRRANEAARARLLASEAAREVVRQTLVAQIAAAYFELLQLDAGLEVSRQLLTSSTKSMELTSERQQHGVAAMQDVRQAEVLVRTAEASIVDFERRIQLKENELSILLGRNPGGIQRGQPLTGQVMPATVPAGLPSALLENRPDIRSAEESLVAANADVGQAKAAFFPQVTLTGTYGFQSVALSDLFTAPARTWQFGPAVTVPLFTGGRLRGNLKLTQAQFEEAVASYQQTVQNAFREVSDALIDRQRLREFTAKQLQLTEAYRDVVRLATMRYDQGVTSYLEVLYNQQKLFEEEIRLTEAQVNELITVVRLYRALGGG